MGVARPPTKHRKPARRRPSLVLVGTTAVGLSTALAFGHAIDNTAAAPQVQLASAVIGIGGRGDPTSANIPAKINHSLVPIGCNCYIPVNYPAGFDIDNSVAAGVPVLDQEIADYRNDNPTSPAIVVVGYSEGALVAENERRDLATSSIPTSQLSFVMIASPNVPDGGIFGRFPTLNLFIVSSNGPAEPSKYDTTYYTNEYDPYADFPTYFNPLSLANSLVAVMYVHPDAYYDTIDLTPAPAGPAYTKTVTNTAGGHDTYVFVLASHLPLFAPVRELSDAIGTTALTEPFLSAIEPLVRVLVDMGYKDRQNLNPEVPTTFSLFTPPGKILEGLAATPGAIAQGATNFGDGVSSATTSTPFSPALAPDNDASPPPSPQLRTSSPPQPQNDPPEADDSGTPPILKAPVSPLAKKGPKLSVVTSTGNKAETPGSAGSPSPDSGSVFSRINSATHESFGRKHDAPTSSDVAGPAAPASDVAGPTAPSADSPSSSGSPSRAKTAS